MECIYRNDNISNIILSMLSKVECTDHEKTHAGTEPGLLIQMKQKKNMWQKM